MPRLLLNLPDFPMTTNNDSGTQQWERHSQPAVSMRHAHKSYGKKKKAIHVLNNLDMTVAKGTIYGLLGASGCGKTTLLSCIVGRRRLEAGEIFVLGGKPGSRQSGVPGKRVGYMPQEIALYEEFTIRETMLYFGWIFAMSTREIEERLQFLLNFLDLPSSKRLVKNLSGGQQRRVSFAVALLHDPELLILDEPTVGVDPLLRQSIWNHLVHITKSGQKTVIITTHYIEEARQAHTIGLMRSGRLLAEDSPSALLSAYKCNSLEEVFLKLSRLQSNKIIMAQVQFNNNISFHALGFGSKIDTPSSSREGGVVGLNFQSKENLIESTGSVFTLMQEPYDPPPPSKRPKEERNVEEWYQRVSKLTSSGKIRALITKNLLRMWRNVGVILFIFVLPVIQVILFCLAIGRDPTNLNLAIVNGEMNDTETCQWNDGCHFTNLGCRYLSHLNKTVIKNFYADVEEAKDAVRKGNAWGAIYITDNFTDAFTARAALGRDADEETIDQSEIKVWLDMSNQQVGVMLNRDIQFAFRDFAMILLEQCGNNPKLGDLPIQFKEPIYGTMEPRFTDFVAPGVIITIVFFLAVALTSSALIIERTEGLFDRSWVAGVTPGEILFSHIVTQFVVMCGQTALVLIFMLCVFGVENKGNLAWVILLTLLQGLCGMCFGFFISSVCDLERTAIQLALGSFYPTLLLSGVIWPIEGMPLVLRYISYCLPLTLATSSLRSILTRGWGVMATQVYMGFLSTLAWILGFLIMTLVAMRSRQAPDKLNEMTDEVRAPDTPKPYDDEWEINSEAAVSIHQAYKAFGKKKHPVIVLNNLTMTVIKGTIYGLLGASGCGKTTLLSCIVGRRRLDSGEIYVLGGVPGSRRSGVPGKRVGYMPQETALYDGFTIKETLLYFGWIFGMKRKTIEERLEALLKFLDLPSGKRSVKHLSGGQQRRVSFAVALLHDPELLILDEPTVGVDPLLRQNIWNHLTAITKTSHQTIIITTHYIEEARQAHMIGLMRSGRLLAEDSPDALLSAYKCKNLEEVFLKLSRLQSIKILMAQQEFSEMSKPESSRKFRKTRSKSLGKEQLQASSGSIYSVLQELYDPPRRSKRLKKNTTVKEKSEKVNSFNKLRALILKNLLHMWRSPGQLFFMVLLPVFQVILFCLAIGHNPRDLNVAIVNEEADMRDTKVCDWDVGCRFTKLGCRYLSHLNTTVIKLFYTDLEEAKHEVVTGRAWGAIYIRKEFTEAFKTRSLIGHLADDEILEKSEIQVWLDMSNQQVGLMLYRDIQLAFRNFAVLLLEQCGQNPKHGDLPIRFEEPIYGSMAPTFTDFVAPGVIVTVVFFLAVALTSSALIVERVEGLYDRSLVAGVTVFEILLSHIITQLMVMCLQTALVLVFMFNIFGLESKGSLIILTALTLLQGLCGMCFGFSISAVCDLERTAVQVALGSFYPILLLSGVMWPLEGMVTPLRMIAYGLPLTLATAAMRSVLTRGWGITVMDVYLGFASTFLWIFIFLIITIITMRSRQL
uniref:ABC transporter domain-containing protein n=1 Tax=Glossina palpalis gambiensis TaxID=67801 RepID=A0A1B0B3C6_9MUSC